MIKQNISKSRNNSSISLFALLIILVMVSSAVSVKADVGNPELSESCGIDIVLVLDSSDSLDNGDIQDVKDAANSFVDALLPGTPTNIGIIDFDTNVVNALAPTMNITDIQNAIDSIGHIGSMEYTNWEAAISEADSMLEAEDLMVIITDGRPTRSNSGGNSLSDAIAAADAAKTNGIRIVAIGIDSNGVNSGLNVNNLKAISGPNVATVPPDVITVDTDVILGDISGLGDILFDLTTALCGGTITVQKLVDGEPVENWEFTANVTGGTADPSFGFTDDNGYIIFDISISPGNTTAYVDIIETQQEEYSFVDAVARDCSGQICTDNGVDSLLAIPVTQNGCPITCIFNNTDSNDPPIFGATDPVNGSSDQDVSLTWSINIEDPDGDTFDWSIECSNGQSSIATDETDGAKQLSISDLNYATVYTVWVNATDAYDSTGEWFTFTTEDNTLPIISDENPVNGSIGQELAFTWSATISDPDESIDWSIECAGQSNTGSGETPGSKSLALTSLSYSAVYTIYVNATDSVGWTREWFIFTTRSKNVPTTPDSLTASANGRFKIDLFWTDNGDDLTYIEWNTVEDWSRGAGTIIYNDTGITYQHIGLDYGTQYFYQAWSYNVTDNSYSSLYAKANDTTLDNQVPIQSNEAPSQNKANVDKMQPSVSINITDPEGDSMSWSIEVSTGDSDNGSGFVGSRTISCNLTTPLSYDLSATWYVNVTDGFDWTNRTYSFTVESAPPDDKTGGSTGGSPSIPSQINKDPVADAGGLYFGYLDEVIKFNGSKSYDIDGSITNYTWGFGDGTFGYERIVDHSYAALGLYNVTLTVKDYKGATDENKTTADIRNLPNKVPSEPNVNGSINGTVDIEYVFNISSTDEDNDLIRYIIDWGDNTTFISDFLLSGEILRITHSWNSPGNYTITAKADDNKTISGDTDENITITEEDIIKSKVEDGSIFWIITAILAMVSLFTTFTLKIRRKIYE